MPLSNTVCPESLLGGEAVYVWRFGMIVPYLHFGIVVFNEEGNLCVIHVQNNSGTEKDFLIRTSLDEFSGGSTLKKVCTAPNLLEKSFYFSGTHIESHFTLEEIMENATKEYEGQLLLDTKPQYHVIHNNCETFTTFCLTGERSSSQTRGLDRIVKQFQRKRVMPLREPKKLAIKI